MRRVYKCFKKWKRRKNFFLFFYERKKKDLKLSGFLETKIISRNVENLYFTRMSKNNFC